MTHSIVEIAQTNSKVTMIFMNLLKF